MAQEIRIGSHLIGPHHPPLIVAELSANHNGSIDRALQIVEAAKHAGAHAIKLQTYTADTLTLDSQEGKFVINDPSSLWKGRNLYELYQQAHMPWEWHSIIFNRCREIGLTAFSTPFDETAVDFLEELDVPCYKIASPEIVDLPLIRKTAKTGKPLIISTGASTLLEIAEAVQTARAAGCRDLILLKCTAAYPSQPKDCHLRTIPHLASTFDVIAGLSDHSLGLAVPLASVALGSCLIEKHFTLSRAGGGPDDPFSLEPNELQALVEESKRAWEALGHIQYAPLRAEKTTLSHRPSLYFIADLSAGEIVQSEHIRSLRPDCGLPPKDLERVIGLPLQKNVKRGTPVTWDIFKNE
ncbi:pseudaminic acid synthase [Candidatus Protochlamydia phocaeensis]|uniref:pseudaminic acid synthase n=1 Tax=Candidatus Protochlamydia phocaeensis TaxID=1414722 RepID=UPI0008390777|nr:pseudaminic acid synthase [Candidatus Protochlamydia phocaeensis]